MTHGFLRLFVIDDFHWGTGLLIVTVFMSVSIPDAIRLLSCLRLSLGGQRLPTHLCVFAASGN